MRLDEVVSLKHEDDFIFAVTVGNEGGFMHCAILYKWEDGKIRTLEFSSNQHINSKRTIGDLGQKGYLFIYYNKDLIIDSIAYQVPSIFELIKENNDSISFGIKFTKTSFDEFGKLVFANGDFGLTCATFLIAIFQRASISLIDLNNWKKRQSDIDWQKRVLEHYDRINKENKENYTDELILYYEQNIGCFRYRPEEVAAATAAPQLPTDYLYCWEFGTRILDALNYGLEYYSTVHCS